MKQKSAYYILVFLSAFTIHCGINHSKAVESKAEFSRVSVDSLPTQTKQDKDTTPEEHLPVNDQMYERLKPIRENYKRINSITNWTSIDTSEFWETPEGEAMFYCQTGHLEKIVTRQLGETFQQLTEYYLMNGRLSFVYERIYRYNRPVYYDTVVMKENKDTEAFDFKKSTLIESRNYFEKGKLIYKIESKNKDASDIPGNTLKEQKRILADFEKIIRLKPKK